MKKLIALLLALICLLSALPAALAAQESPQPIPVVAPEDRTPEDAYAERMQRCRECDYLEQGMCRACGCYVELRAAKKTQHCSYDHW